MGQHSMIGDEVTFGSAAERREAHASALCEMRRAVESLLEGAATDAGRDLLLEDLRAAHEAAASTGVYESCDGEDPIIEATHQVVSLLIPAIDQQLEFEALYGRDPQKEVSADNLSWMARHILGSRDLPSDKISRWLGFIQGVLAVRGRLSVSAERDATRPIFHRAYSLMRISKPRSASMAGDIHAVSNRLAGTNGEPQGDD
jgi:hypothetical protein